ncbi:hypothetical protein MINS_11970 [Mycolicibacterium insubricum]|uniref:Uncharacterized protein n=1 Tax=Mycolicibacterium insubricum TaxID=444597 RepID=A0A1X0CXI1_9MYCO|nr:hypothetical protein [Mycolicibacterium insubricum]MCV7079998.1 hypothetical protein [Mycolicibacterium insubricum]ORA64891.1 hypothetical protein BST26_19480 [Mycolicibacterium insubricum]BBZ65768.1 hypothetical protein MINS_11970 [Mycolicibacterium insubricum]
MTTTETFGRGDMIAATAAATAASKAEYPDRLAVHLGAWELDVQRRLAQLEHLRHWLLFGSPIVARPWLVPAGVAVESGAAR